MTRIPSSPRHAGVALLLLLSASLLAADVNRIVLRVNDRIATLYDYEKVKRERIESLRRSDLPPDRQQELLAEIGVATMRDLYEELLLLSRADQLDLRVSAEQVAAAVNETRASYGIETEEDFERALERSGLTREGLRQQIERNLLMREVMGREVQPRIQLQEEDLRRYYQAHLEEFRVPERRLLREIVVLDSGTPDPAARSELAAELRQQQLSGAADERIAELEGQGLVTGWIDFGWMRPGDLDRALERAVWDLTPGSISEPIEARGGLHLVQVMEARPAEVLSFAEARDQIEARERGRVFSEEVAEYVADLERRSYVVVDPPPEAAGFRTSRGPAPGDELEGIEKSLSPVGVPEGVPPPAAAEESAAEEPPPTAEADEAPAEADEPPAEADEPPAEADAPPAHGE